LVLNVCTYLGCMCIECVVCAAYMIYVCVVCMCVHVCTCCVCCVSMFYVWMYVCNISLFCIYWVSCLFAQGVSCLHTKSMFFFASCMFVLISMLFLCVPIVTKFARFVYHVWFELCMLLACCECDVILLRVLVCLCVESMCYMCV
jgi:hypothetical protein